MLAALSVVVQLSTQVAAGQSDPLTRENLDAAIARHRMGELIVVGPPNTPVEVIQRRHRFWFGAALANSIFERLQGTPTAQTYKRVFLENFNAAVTENALKWHVMEPVRGRIHYGTVDAILEWAEAHRIPLRGHNIFWGIPNRVPAWQKSLDQEALREVVRRRALDIGRRYRGRFAEYDLNNEMIHGDYYAERLGPGITKQMALWVREADPDAVLFLNDYDILTGRRLADYLRHIRSLLAQGVPIGGIGVQGHLHGETFDAPAMWRALDALGQFGLPVRITEFNLPGQRSRFYRDRQARLTPDQEKARARELERFYRIAFAHPAVHGILMWGFWEGANWIPASSIFRRDWSPTPAAQAYRRLVFQEWWTRWKGRTDTEGRCRVRAFLGEHTVSLGGATRTVRLETNREPLVVRFD